jgi:hypothetical protein
MIAEHVGKYQSFHLYMHEKLELSVVYQVRGDYGLTHLMTPFGQQAPAT